MLRWGLTCSVLVVWARAASAQDVAASVAPAEPASGPVQVVGYGAMPGGIHVPDASTLPAGALELITLDGYGFRKGALAVDHTMSRAIGSLAIAYGIHELFTLGLSLDGRYDSHDKGPMGSDTGLVGDPHLIARLAKAFGSARFGAQIGIWVPGKDAPSIAASATSVDFRALASLPAGPGILSFEVGYQLDNSASSVDMVESLSLADRMSLGVSDFNEVFGGAHLAIPFGKAWFGAEASLDAFLGDPPTNADGSVKNGHAALVDGKLSFRGGVSGGYRINDQFAILAFAEMAKVPYVTLSQVAANNIPLIPYEPVFTAGIGISAQFGNSKTQTQFKGCAYTAEGCPAVETPILVEISGSVVDEADKPVVGAKVALKLANVTVDPVATDQTGKYTFKAVRIGTQADATQSKPAVHRIDDPSGTVSVEVDNKKPGSATVANLDGGTTVVPPIKLEPMLPPGQLRGVVHSLPNGKAIEHATITVSPGNAKVESSADGTFTLDLAPGQYKITVKAGSFASQDLDVTIEPNGVAIKNIDLHK